MKKVKESERKRFYIVCGKCDEPYRVELAEKEYIDGECPRCGEPIVVGMYRNRLFEIKDEKWIPMIAERIFGVAG